MKNQAKVNEVVNSLKQFSDEERAEILQEVLKQTSIGVSVDAECTDWTKSAEFTFSNVKLQFNTGKIYDGSIDLKYMEKGTTLLKF